MRPSQRGLAAALALSLCALAAHAQVTPDTGWAARRGFRSAYRAGNYTEVIQGAPATLAAEPWNNELRLAYAYSLIWSGREWQSTAEFEKLRGTEVEVDARLGLANSYAWTGRLGESLPHYRLLTGTNTPRD